MPAFNSQFITERKDGDFLTRSVKPSVGKDAEKRVYVHGGNEFCYRVDELNTMLIAQCPYTNCEGCHLHRNKSTRKRVDGTDKATSEIAAEKRAERRNVLNGKAKSNAVSAEMRVFRRHGILMQRNRLVPCDKGSDCDQMYCHYHNGTVERPLHEYLDMDYPVDRLNLINFDDEPSRCYLRAGPELKTDPTDSDTTAVNRHQAAGIPSPVVYNDVVTSAVDFVLAQTKNEGVRDIFDFFNLLSKVVPDMTVEIVEDAVSCYNNKMIDLENAPDAPPGLSRKSLYQGGVRGQLTEWLDLVTTYQKPVEVVRAEIKRDIVHRVPEEVFQLAPGPKKKTNHKTRRGGILRQVQRQEVVSAWPEHESVKPTETETLRQPLLEIDLIPPQFRILDGLIVDDDEEDAPLTLGETPSPIIKVPKRNLNVEPVIVNMMNEIELDNPAAMEVDQPVGMLVANVGQADLSFVDPNRGPEMSPPDNFERMRLAWMNNPVHNNGYMENLLTLAVYLEQYTLIFNNLQQELTYEDFLDLCVRITIWARDGEILPPAPKGMFPVASVVAHVLLGLYKREHEPTHAMARLALGWFGMTNYTQLHARIMMQAQGVYNQHAVNTQIVPVKVDPVPGVLRAPRMINLVPPEADPQEGEDEQPAKRRRVVDLDEPASDDDDTNSEVRPPNGVRPIPVQDWLRQQQRHVRIQLPEDLQLSSDSEDDEHDSHHSDDSSVDTDTIIQAFWGDDEELMDDSVLDALIEDDRIARMELIVPGDDGGSTISSLTVPTGIHSDSTTTVASPRPKTAVCRLVTPVDVKVDDPTDPKKKIVEVYNYFWVRYERDFFASAVYGDFGEYVDNLKTVEVAMTADKPVLTETSFQHFTRQLYDWLFVKDQVGALTTLSGQTVKQIHEAQFQAALSATTLGWLCGLKDGATRSHAVKLDLLNSAYSVKKQVDIFEKLAHRWHVEFLSKVSSTPNRNVNATPATWIMSEIMASVKNDKFTAEERAVYTSIENIVILLDTVNFVINEIVIKTNQLANMMPHRGTKLAKSGTRVHALRTGDWALGTDFQ